MTPPTYSRAVTMMNQLTFQLILPLPSVHQSTRLMFHLFLIFFLLFVCCFCIYSCLNGVRHLNILNRGEKREKRMQKWRIELEVGQTFYMVDRHILKIHCLFASCVVILSCRENINTNTTNSASPNRLLPLPPSLLPPSSPPPLLPASPSPSQKDKWKKKQEEVNEWVPGVWRASLVSDDVIIIIIIVHV